MSSSRTKSKKPVSRRKYDDAMSYNEELLQCLRDGTRVQENLQEQCRSWKARADEIAIAKSAIETERDQLKVAHEIEREARRRWQANFTAVSQRNARLQRQRELLLDVMTSAEDAGTDFSGLHHSIGGFDQVQPDSSMNAVASYKVAG